MRSSPVTLRTEVFERDGNRCQFCLVKRAEHLDHLIRISLRRRHKVKDEADYLTAACRDCNMYKGTLPLIPRSRAHMIPALAARWPHVDWRLWDGNPRTRYPS